MRLPGLGHFRREDRGFTGAEKALIACCGLAVVAGAGYLVRQGSAAASGDAKRTLIEQRGGGDVQALGRAVATPGAVASPGGAQAPGASPAPGAFALASFSSDFRPAAAAGAAEAAPPQRVAAPATPAPALPTGQTGAGAPAPGGATPTPASGITQAQLQRIMPALPAEKAAAYIGPLDAAMREYGIGTPAREAAFLAQLAHESVQLRYFEEIASGREYEGRKDLGNVNPGDGVRYKGRGPIQLTGRANYRAAGKALGLDLEGHPELAATPEVGFRIAGWYWQQHGLNQLADQGNFREITHRINGGFNGEASREAFYRTAKGVLGVK